MKRVQLSCSFLRSEDGIATSLHRCLKIELTHDLLRNIEDRLHGLAHDTIIAVESLDMRLHLDSALQIVTFCYEYGFQLDLIDNDRENLINAFISKFQSTHRIDRKTAFRTLDKLFNGQGQTLIKRRDTKPFSVEEIQETK